MHEQFVRIVVSLQSVENVSKDAINLTIDYLVM